MKGQFYINRKLLQSTLWLEEPFTRGQAWVDLIGLANHADGWIRISGEKIPVKRGQCGWSETRLSQRWKWSRGKTRRFLIELKNDEKIDKKTNNKTTVITICNYEEYQIEDIGDGTAVGTPNSTTDGLQTDTNSKYKDILDKEVSKKESKIIGTRFLIKILPDDWREFCQKERPDLDAKKVFLEFGDYWVAVAGQKGVKADWFATWRNWVRRSYAPAAGFGKPASQPHLKKAYHETITGYKT